MRLFCFPYAGGAANIYKNWAEVLAPEIEVIAIQLPGHGTRIKESIYARLHPTIHALVSSMHPALDKPYSLFGHSLGALLAFHFALEIKSLHALPEILFLSASKAPKQQATHGIHSLEDTHFTTQLKTLNGTPEAVFDNRELLDLILPILRADFAMAETYTIEPNRRVDVPIIAISGNQDVGSSQKDMQYWKDFTSNSFENILLPGDHFFIQSQEATITTIIKERMAKIS